MAGIHRLHIPEKNRPQKMQFKKTKPDLSSDQNHPNAQSANCVTFIGVGPDCDRPGYHQYKGRLESGCEARV